MKVLVTGASSRIGECIANAFSPGNQLLLVARNPARLEETKATCLQSGATAGESGICGRGIESAPNA